MLDFKKYTNNEMLKSDLKSMTFIIVEDQIEVQLKLESDLKALGFIGKLIFCTSGEEALHILKIVDIDFMFLDWNLRGELTGFEVLKIVRKSKRFAKLPIIMFTVKNEVEFILDAVKEGASDYLLKPWDRSEVRNKIRLTITHEYKKFKTSA
jgi:DNA-binding response OmpR family regulator